MKLLILAPSFTGSLWKAVQFKKRIDELIDSALEGDDADEFGVEKVF